MRGGVGANTLSKNMKLGSKFKVAIFGHLYQSDENRTVWAVVRKLNDLGAEVQMEEAFYHHIKASMPSDVGAVTPQIAAGIEADWAVSMGGDGTFLRTAAAIGAKEIPILGVNTGHLGFLADVSADNIHAELEAVVAGEYVIERHSVIQAQKDGKPLSTYPYALNEVALLKHDNSSIIEVAAKINGELLTVYRADGLMVCTPTGSTGYSLSVGGPIIVPQSNTFCLSPVASHSLSTRPVVLCDDAEISLTVRSRSHNFLISIDGRSDSFPDGTTVVLRRAPYCVRVMKVKHKSFFTTLRDKMMWGADGRF